MKHKIETIEGIGKLILKFANRVDLLEAARADTAPEVAHSKAQRIADPLAETNVKIRLSPQAPSPSGLVAAIGSRQQRESPHQI